MASEYEKRVDEKVSRIDDEKLRDVMRAGTRSGDAMRSTFTDSSIEFVVDKILELQKKAGIESVAHPMPEGYPARFVK